MPEPAPFHPRPETDGEILPVVDMDDRLVGSATRREIHERGLMHRAVHVLVLDNDGRLLLQRRSERKDTFPGWWDLSVGGHVGVEEAYVEAAVRELDEEMGIAGAEPSLVGVVAPCELTGWEFVHIFWCRHAGELSPQESEVIETRWEDAEALLARASWRDDAEPHWRLSPSGLNSIRLWHSLGSPGWRRR